MQYPKPTLYQYVNDYAKIMDEDSTLEIITLGRELEKVTSAQAVVVTIETLDGVPIETYANGLFRTWGIGQKNKDNGLLILVAAKEKQWRVEVGRTLEGAITDAGSHQIMTQLALPSFEKGEYGRGLASAYSQLCDDIAKEYNMTLIHSAHTTLPSKDNEANSQRGNGSLIYMIIIGLAVIDLLFNRGRGLRLLFISSLLSGGGRRGGGGNFGGGAGGGFGGGSSRGGGSSGGW